MKIKLFGFCLSLLMMVGIGNYQGYLYGQATLDKHPRSKSTPFNNAIDQFFGNKADKIVGGRPANPGQFPWQISLGVSWLVDPYGAHFCGGSILSDRWILTAAHCMEDLNPWDIVVTAGSHELVSGATRVNVKRIISHKNYNRSTFDNDLALIELWSPLSVGGAIQSVSLIDPTAEDTILVKDAPLVVTGWGRTSEQGTKVRRLNYIDDLPFLPRNTCNGPLSYDGRVTENMICAGRRTGGGDSCQGDSGGPLSVEGPNGPTQVGVVSWGEGCGRPNKVGVYTRLANYVGWIKACMSDPSKCNN